MPSKHSILGPSGATRWGNCPGSAAMSIPFEDKNDSSSFAEEGTAAHELAEWALTSDKDCDAFMGRITSNGYEVTEDMVRDTQVYVDAVRDYAQGNVLIVEREVSIEHITGEPEAMGTSDANIINKRERELQVHDLKFGKGVRVDASKFDWEDGPGSVRIEKPNPQIALYALGVYEELKDFIDIDTVLLVIHQPRLGHLSEFRLSLADLLAFGEEMRVKSRLAWGIYETAKLNPKAVINDNVLSPSPDACQWCKAKAICPALRKKAITAVMDEFEDISDVEALTPAALDQAIIKVDNLADDKIDLLYPLLELIEDWGRAVLARIDKRLHEGASFNSCKLVQGKRGNRAWADKNEVEQTMKAMRLKQEEMYEFSLIGVVKAQKLLEKQNPKRWAKLQAMITQSDGRPSVAPANDKREALIIKPPVSDFADETEAQDLVA